jgi:hypothetical protein
LTDGERHSGTAEIVPCLENLGRNPLIRLVPAGESAGRLLAPLAALSPKAGEGRGSFHSFADVASNMTE